jgi:hypothetical protein
MGVSHSRLSGMDASAMHSRIGEADAAVTIGGVGLGSEVIRELTRIDSRLGECGAPPGGESGRSTIRLDWSSRLFVPTAASRFYMSRCVLPKSLADVT